MENLNLSVRVASYGDSLQVCSYSMCLSSYRAVHNLLHALMIRVISTRVPDDYLCSPQYLSLFYVYLRSLSLASRQPIASSCTDDGKDPSFITSP